MAAYGGTTTISGSSYGDLSKNDAFTIQKKMLPIAKRLLTFAKFAQKETKPQKQGQKSGTADMSGSQSQTPQWLKV